MIIAGIDYSIRCPAICVVNTDNIKQPSDLKDFGNFQFFATYEDHRKKNQDVFGTLGSLSNIHLENMSGDYLNPEKRFRNIKEWAAKVLVGQGVDEVVLEGFSMGSRVGLIFQIAENASVLKQWLHWRDIPFSCPAPTSVKKTFTGKGTAKKFQMLEQFETWFQINLAKEILGEEPPVLKSKNNEPVDPIRPVADLVDAFANMMCHPLLLPIYEKAKI